MSKATRLMLGLTLLIVPTIQYGGWFLLTSLLDRSSIYWESPLLRAFFRAGHAHAGVLVLLSLICQIAIDASRLASPLQCAVRIGAFIAPMLVSGGFFFSVLPPGREEVNAFIWLLYAGIAVLAASVIVLGIGLIRSAISRPAT